MNSDWDEEENSKKALEKFQTDVTMVPDNQFAWFNAAALLIENNHNEEAWDSFRTALQVGIPQRYLLYDFSLYEAAFKNGLAEELRDRTAAMLKINNHSEENWLWNGWAYTLLQDRSEAENAFEKSWILIRTTATDNMRWNTSNSMNKEMGRTQNGKEE